MWSADAAVFWQVSALFTMYGGRHSQPVHCYTCTAIGIFFAPLLFYVFFCSCLTFFFAPHARTFWLRRNGFCPPPLPMACGLACFLCCFRFLSSLWFLLALRIFTLFSPFTVFFRTFCGVDFSLIANTKLQNKSNPHRRRKKATNVSFTFSSSSPVFIQSTLFCNANASISVVLASSAARVAGFPSLPFLSSVLFVFHFRLWRIPLALPFFSGCTFGVFDWLRFGIKIGRFFKVLFICFSSFFPSEVLQELMRHFRGLDCCV